MPAISLKSEEVFHLLGFPITNTFILTLIVVALIAGTTFFLLKRKMRLVPDGFQNVAESVTEGILDFMDNVLGSRNLSEKYLPLIASIFFFVIIANWSGLVPGVGSFGLQEEHGFVPFLRSPASDLNTTLALALVSVVMINVFAIKKLGFGGHIKKFFNFRSPIGFFIGVLELISEFAKIVSFSFRLFGNVFAGEVLLIIVTFLVPYFIPAPFMLMEIFVGFVQAFVFAMLTLVFIAIAITGHEEEHSAKHPEQKVVNQSAS